MDLAATELIKLLANFVKGKNTMPNIVACTAEFANHPQLKLNLIKAITNQSRRTAVHKAAGYDLSIILDNLFKHLGAEEKYELLKMRDSCGNLPIHEAVRCISIDALERVLGEPKKIKLLQMRNKKGDTPIHCAAIADDTRSIEIMFKGVAEETINELLKIRNEQGDTAVLGGILEGKKKVVGYILEIAAADDRVNLLRMKNFHGNVLRCAALADHVMPFWFTRPDELFELMEEKNESGQTPMHCVMSQGHANVVETMLTHAKNCGEIDKYMNLLNNKDANGDTPVHCAAAAGQVELLKKAEKCLTPAQWKKLLGIKNNDKETPADKAKSALNRFQETVSLFK